MPELTETGKRILHNLKNNNLDFESYDNNISVLDKKVYDYDGHQDNHGATYDFMHILYFYSSRQDLINITKFFNYVVDEHFDLIQRLNPYDIERIFTTSALPQETLDGFFTKIIAKSPDIIGRLNSEHFLTIVCSPKSSEKTAMTILRYAMLYHPHIIKDATYNDIRSTMQRLIIGRSYDEAHCLNNMGDRILFINYIIREQPHLAHIVLDSIVFYSKFPEFDVVDQKTLGKLISTVIAVNIVDNKTIINNVMDILLQNRAQGFLCSFMQEIDGAVLRQILPGLVTVLRKNGIEKFEDLEKYANDMSQCSKRLKEPLKRFSNLFYSKNNRWITHTEARSILQNVDKRFTTIIENQRQGMQQQQMQR